VQNVRIWQPVLGWAPRSSKTPSSTRTREAVVVAVRPRKGAQRRCGRWGDGFAVYPMPMFARLAMSDLQASVAWYTEALGFGVVFVGPEIDGRPLMAPSPTPVPGPAPGTGDGPAADGSGAHDTLSADGEVDSLGERVRRVAAVGAQGPRGRL
jgi:hypothetical protein